MTHYPAALYQPLPPNHTTGNTPHQTPVGQHIIHTGKTVPVLVIPNCATVASDLTRRRRLLTLLCGHQEITTFLTAIDTVQVEYPEYSETLAILSLVFTLEFHSQPRQWCLFHTFSYQQDLCWYFSNPDQHRLIRLYLQSISRWPPL
jgi:hypothetical protein